MDKLRIRLQKGSMMVLFAVLLPIFVFFLSVVVDLARAQAHRSYLQNIADAAALAGVNTIEHTGTARVVPDCPGNAVPVPDKETNADLEARNSIRSNTGSENPFTNIAMELKLAGDEVNGSYYYGVTIEDHVPLLLARVFLPDSIMPDGIPIWPPIVAWASVNYSFAEGDIFSQIDNIGTEQIIKDYKTLKAVIGKGAAADRVENLARNNKDKHLPEDVNLPNGIYFSASDGNVVRTETVVPNKVNTWKYMFVEFQPDISINKTNGILKDGTYYFPFDSWDVGIDLTSAQWDIVNYAHIAGLDGSGAKRANVIKRIRDQFGLSEEEANEVLDSAITNVVSFSALHTVRGGIEEIPESNVNGRRQALETWETNKKKSGGVADTEKKIADKIGNAALADLVVRSTKKIPGEDNKYYISSYDPLLVKIESEDINDVTSGDNTQFFASSTRNLKLKIDVDNTGIQYRPLIIYYYGPEDRYGNTGDNQTGVKRESRLVTLELNADFKGILFAPNSPVTIKTNGHKIRGLVIAKSYQLENGTTINTNGSIASAFGIGSNDLIFDDFDMFYIDPLKRIPSNVILTSYQAKQLN